MPAVIESTLYDAPLPGGLVIAGSTQQNSRDDLRKNYGVALRSFDVATTYSWSLSFAPDSPGSIGEGTPFDGTQNTAALLPPEGSTSRDAKFNVDFEGAYLVRLVVDAGLPTEDTQFVRLRRLTDFADIKLVSAGERRDEKGVIPVDATAEGWSNDQNANFQRILTLLKRVSVSGRVLFVDANRGRDSSEAVNDPSNLIYIPGTDPNDTERTGIKTRAEGYGDFFTINEAITYAVTAPARNEPAPSITEPYFIVIQPGLYIEDLNIASHIHLLSAAAMRTISTWSNSGPVNLLFNNSNVEVRAANTAGATHTYNPQGPFDTDNMVMVGLNLRNTASTAQPVLLHQGGRLTMLDTIVEQGGNGVGQGEAIRSLTANIAHRLSLNLINCTLKSSAVDDDERYCVRVNAPESHFHMRGGTISGRAGVVFNEGLYTGTSQLISSRMESVQVIAERPFHGYGVNNQFIDGEIIATGALPAISIDPFGGAPNSLAADLNVDVRGTTITGNVEIATLGASGTTSIRYGDVTQKSGLLVFTDAPGDTPDNVFYGSEAVSLRHVSDWSRLKLGSPGTPTVAAAKQLPFGNVQDAIDFLTNAVMPLGTSPFYSLDSDYDGLASIDPFVLGSGLGKTITADQGAVQIIAATGPLGLDNWRKDGGLQVEGIIDIGGLVSGAGTQTVADIGGSEIHLNPDPMGAGPFIGLGRVNWPSDVINTGRGFGAAMIVANSTDTLPAPGPSTPYNLHLRTTWDQVSTLGRLGTIYMSAGGTYGNTADGGEVHIQGGSIGDAASPMSPGDIWLAPGILESGNPGFVWFVGSGPATLPASVKAAGAVGAVVAGTIYFATPIGIEGFTFAGGETAAAAVTLINATARGLQAVEVAGVITVSSGIGPSSDIIYIGDTVAGALNASLGDFLVSGGAVFTAGTYDFKLKVDVPVDGRFRINGDLEVTGSLIGAWLAYKHITDAVDGPLYSVLDTENIIGVDSSGGTVVNVEPKLTRPTGSILIIKHELGTGVVTFKPLAPETVEGEVGEEIGPRGDAVFSGGSTGYYKGPGGIWQRIFQSRPYGMSVLPIADVTADFIVTHAVPAEIIPVAISPLFDLTITLDGALPRGRKVTIKDKAGLASGVPVSFTTPTGGGGNFGFVDSNPDTITRTAGSFIADGFLPGMTITVAAATVPANNGTYTIDAGGVAVGTLTLTGGDALTADAADVAATISFGPLTTKIIVDPAGGNVDGAATFDLTSAYGAVTVVKVSATDWMVV